jgi:hypothetical protein
MTCVTMPDKKLCASRCDTKFEGARSEPYCKDPSLTPSDVGAKKGATNLGSIGCYCLPR